MLELEMEFVVQYFIVTKIEIIFNNIMEIKTTFAFQELVISKNEDYNTEME